MGKRHFQSENILYYQFIYKICTQNQWAHIKFPVSSFFYKMAYCAVYSAVWVLRPCNWGFDILWPVIGVNYRWWCQNQNFGDPHGCLVSQYKPFGKKISFLAWKKTLEPFRARFENTMGNPFFNFFKYWPIRSKTKI